MKVMTQVLCACMVGLALCGGVRADPKADELLKRVEAATRATQSLTADIVMTVAGEGVPPAARRTTGTVKLKKPNLAKIELSGGQEMTMVSDGTTLWQLMRGGTVYMKSDVSPAGEEIEALWALPVPYFFQPGTDFFRVGAPDATKYLGVEQVEGVAYEVVELALTKPAPITLRMFIGPDNLFHRSRVTIKDDDSRVFEAALTNVRAGVPFAAAEFSFTPPATARLYEEPDYEATLVAVGQKAPRFDLPTPQGGKLALENTLKDKRAVLINFWFYN